MENPGGILYDTLRSKQNSYFADDFSNSFLVKENVLNFVENIAGGLIDDTSALVQVRAWHRLCDQLLTETMLTKYCDAT